MSRTCDNNERAALRSMTTAEFADVHRDFLFGFQRGVRVIGLDGRMVYALRHLLERPVRWTGRPSPK